MAGDKLSKTAVAERALRIGDEHGLEAVTIRRLAQELGVTPMALYWHFKNKEELLLGIADHALSTVRADRDADDPWQKQVRAMVEALLAVMRKHPSLPDLLAMVEKSRTASFTRASNDALMLLTRAGFTVRQGYWIASYLMHGVIGLLQMQPEGPPHASPEETAEWRRQRRLELVCLPPDQFPMMVEFGETYADTPDQEAYFAFGVDLLMAAVEKMAETAEGPAGASPTGP
ncbi:TetR family transcriptional regulator [Actinoplanes sp. NPDC048796]|uniref:TetR family transcriptional regulator n=1 Tax=unclassified Actinoplanes TaxID=2626549 RepID=UPI0033FFCC4D